MKNLFVCLLAVLAVSAAAAEETYVFNTPEGWRGERIKLPAPFAPDMKIKGMEELRFAPGMFNPDSDTFFTYVFIFSSPGKKVFTKDVIKREILAYYRGLAKQVLQGKKKVDVNTFTLKLEAVEKAANVPAKAQNATAYSGTLDWVEPFKTAKAQTLYVELIAWHYADSDNGYLFVSVSPKKTTDKLWKTLRAIQAAFKVKP